jgi:hypothetical protein
MVHLNMLSGNFAHAYCSTWWKRPKNLIWDFNSRENNISVYIDGGMWAGFGDKNDGKKKFLWILESKSYDGGTSEQAKILVDRLKETFEQVWTHNDELLKLDPIFKWSPAYGSYIESPKIHDKTKLISMITSDKQATEQHQFRYNFAVKNKNMLDLYGRGFNEIEKKETGLNDYMFSVAIENNTYDTYFTEKILDCFLTGTIPIFKGTKKIVNYFDSNGIIFLDEIDNLSELTSDLYYSKMDSIKENFERAFEYELLDDWLFEKYIKNYV